MRGKLEESLSLNLNSFFSHICIKFEQHSLVGLPLVSVVYIVFYAGFVVQLRALISLLGSSEWAF